MDIFSAEADKLLREHIDEFFVSGEMDVVTHVGCEIILLQRPASPWGLRSVALGHLRRKHQ